MEEIEAAHNAYSTVGVTNGLTLVALPSVVEMLLQSFGYHTEVLWMPPMEGVEGIEDFRSGRRVAILGSR